MGFVLRAGRTYQATCDVCNTPVAQFVEAPARIAEADIPAWAAEQDKKRRTFCEKPPSPGQRSCRDQVMQSPELVAQRARVAARRRVQALIDQDPELLEELLAERRAAKAGG